MQEQYSYDFRIFPRFFTDNEPYLNQSKESNNEQSTVCNNTLPAGILEYGTIPVPDRTIPEPELQVL